MSNEVETIVVTPEFRVSYPKVFKAERNELNGNDEFSLVCLFPKGADLSKLKAAAQAAGVKKWGADTKKWPKNLRSPFRDQADREKEDDDGNKYMPDGYVIGATYVSPKSNKRPGLVDAGNQDIIDENEFYGGCYARAQLNFSAYDKKGNAGIGVYINHVQKLRDGPSFGSAARNASDVFEPVNDPNEGGRTTIDHTAGGMFD